MGQGNDNAVSHIGIYGFGLPREREKRHGHSQNCADPAHFHRRWMLDIMDSGDNQ